MKRFLLYLLFLPELVLAQCVGTPNYAPQHLESGLSSKFIVTSNASFVDASFSHPSGDDFDINIMGRTPAQQASQKADAVSFFQSYYGVDFSGGDFSPDFKWVLIHQTVDPRFDQKIYFSGGEMVPTDGWVLHEGYYRAIALDDAATIYGTYGGGGGRTVLLGTSMLYGEYRIEKRIPCETSGFQLSSVDIDYYSLRPIFPDILATNLGYSSVRSPVDYFVSFDPDTGVTGASRGRVELVDNGGGSLTAVVRKVIKFYTP